MPLPRGWILNLMEGDHTFRVTFFRPSSIMWWRQGPNDWEMFVWKVGRAKTFSLIVVTTDGEVGLHVGAERAEMGRLSRQEAMMAAQTAFSPRSPQMRTFFEQVSSVSSQPFPRCWGTPASKIPICCQYLNQCQHPLQQNLNWLKYVSVRVYVLLLLFISKEWNFVHVMIFVGKVFFCWKSSWNIRPKTFCLPKYFGVMYTLPWNCPEEEKILEIFSGRGRSNFFRAGQGSVESFTGLGKSGHPFPGQDVCACASLI